MNYFSPKEGVEWSTEALERAEKYEPHLVSRCLLYQGIGYHLQAEQIYVRQEKESLHKSALNALTK